MALTHIATWCLALHHTFLVLLLQMLDDPVGDAGCHSHAGNSSSVLQAQSGPMAAEVAAGTNYHQVTVLAYRPYLTGIVHLLCLAQGWVFESAQQLARSAPTQPGDRGVQGGAASCNSGLLISLWVAQEMTSWTPASWQTDLRRQQGQPLAEGDEGEHQGNQQQKHPQVAGLLQAVAVVMSRHQERLEQFRQRAFLSMSRNTSSSLQQQQQQQQQQQGSGVSKANQLVTI